MKKIILCAATLLIALAGVSQTTKVNFEQGDFNSVLEKATKSNKLIFMDIYAAWCGPCKKLDREVFSDNKFAEHFNKHFINYKIDGEKGEGAKLSHKFGIKAYPTLFFLNNKGEVVHKIVGYINAAELILEANKLLK